MERSSPKHGHILLNAAWDLGHQILGLSPGLEIEHDVLLVQAAGVRDIDSCMAISEHCEGTAVDTRVFGVLSSTSRYQARQQLWLVLVCICLAMAAGSRCLYSGRGWMQTHVVVGPGPQQALAPTVAILQLSGPRLLVCTCMAAGSPCGGAHGSEDQWEELGQGHAGAQLEGLAAVELSLAWKAGEVGCSHCSSFPGKGTLLSWDVPSCCVTSACRTGWCRENEVILSSFSALLFSEDFCSTVSLSFLKWLLNSSRAMFLYGWLCNCWSYGRHRGCGSCSTSPGFLTLLL